MESAKFARIYRNLLQVPITELKKRDPKGIYENFQNGKVKNVSGLDLQVDEPLEADWVEVFDLNLNQYCQKLISYIKEKLKNETEWDYSDLADAYLKHFIIDKHRSNAIILV